MPFNLAGRMDGRSLCETQVIVTYGGYILPLVSREGHMYLDFNGKPTIDDLVQYPSVHLTSPHPWDPTILDAPNCYHSLTADGWEHGSPNGPTENSKPKILSTRVPNGFFRSRRDQDSSAVNPMFEFDPYDNSRILVSAGSHPMEVSVRCMVTSWKLSW